METRDMQIKTFIFGLFRRNFHPLMSNLIANHPITNRFFFHKIIGMKFDNFLCTWNLQTNPRSLTEWLFAITMISTKTHDILDSFLNFLYKKSLKKKFVKKNWTVCHELQSRLLRIIQIYNEKKISNVFNCSELELDFELQSVIRTYT